MKEQIDQLTELFERLRRSGLPLGIEEYLLLLEALRLGFGQPDRAALERLCRVLWLVSKEDERLFKYHFDQVIGNWSPELVKEEVVHPPLSEPVLAPETTMEESKAELTPEAAETTKIDLVEAADIAQITSDPLTLAQTAQYLADRESESFTRQYLLRGEYLPVSRRQVKQNWRYLRRMVRTGPRVELDMLATLRQIGRQGVLVQPVLRPRRGNQATLLLLLDQHGSMVPFHNLARSLAETARSAGCFGEAGVYYFHNCPPLQPGKFTILSDDPYREHLLFKEAQCIDAEPISTIMAKLADKQPDVLIFSDAGAARGGWNRDRVAATATFLYQLRTLGAKQFAWLNPMPPDRWPETTAGAIETFIHMFAMDRQGLHQAIKVLRGHSRQIRTF